MFPEGSLWTAVLAALALPLDLTLPLSREFGMRTSRVTGCDLREGWRRQHP